MKKRDLCYWFILLGNKYSLLFCCIVEIQKLLRVPSLLYIKPIKASCFGGITSALLCIQHYNVIQQFMCSPFLWRVLEWAQLPCDLRTLRNKNSSYARKLSSSCSILHLFSAVTCRHCQLTSHCQELNVRWKKVKPIAENWGTQSFKRYKMLVEKLIMPR